MNRASLALVFSLWSTAGVALTYPPTVDPTYGIDPKSQLFSASPFAVPETLAAKWIWSAKSDNETIYIRRIFSLSRAPKSASLYATADDSFEIYVNGQRVGGSPLPPRDLDWSNVRRFHVAKLLRAGPNIIAVRAVNQGGAAGVLARLDVDGKEVLTTDENWRLSDRTDLKATWDQVDFDDSSWAKATVVAALGQGPWGKGLTNWPSAHNDAPYMAHKVVSPKSLQVISGADQVTGAEKIGADGGVRIKVTPAEGRPAPVLIIEFGQELAGRAQVWGSDGANISVTTGESREECDHAEPQLNNNGPFPLSLAGTEPASTPYTAFRYAKLTFADQTPVEITRVICDHKYYPVQYLGSFDCSDPLLTRIWYTGAYTAHLCMQEEIWDAPKRDRGLWIGDLQVSGQTISTVFGDKFLMEHSIALVREQAQGGRPATELPTKDVNDLPAYSAAWFCTLADFYRHVGDRNFLMGQHQNILSLLNFEETKFDASDVYVHNVRWEFCDWAPDCVLDSPAVRATTYMYIIYGMREASYLLREMGDTANADKYAARADKLTADARAQFTDSNMHTFGTHIQENAMAVISETAKPEDDKSIFEQVLRPENANWKAHLTGNIDESSVITPYYGYFVLNALEKVGEHQEAIDLIRRYWGDMLRRGATTWWEKFDPAWPDDLKITLDKMPYLSLSHGWSSGPTSFLTQTVLGVCPTGAGYSTVDVHPQLGDLNWAEGDVPTPSGTIHVRVERDGATTTATVRLPANVSADISLEKKTLKANGAGTYQLASP